MCRWVLSFCVINEYVFICNTNNNTTSPLNWIEYPQSLHNQETTWTRKANGVSSSLYFMTEVVKCLSQMIYYSTEKWGFVHRVAIFTVQCRIPRSQADQLNRRKIEHQLVSRSNTQKYETLFTKYMVTERKKCRKSTRIQRPKNKKPNCLTMISTYLSITTCRSRTDFISDKQIINMSINQSINQSIFRVA